MKKTMFLFLLSFIMLGLTACGTPEVDKTFENETIEVQEEAQDAAESAVSVLVYDDEYITVYYVGSDNDMPGLKFKVANKSDQDIRFAFDEIAVNGATEQPAYAADILAGTEAEYTCDVSTLEGMETLTAKLFIGDNEGYEIKEGSIKDIPLK